MILQKIQEAAIVAFCFCSREPIGVYLESESLGVE